MKHTPALGAALCAALLFTPLVRAQDLYVGSNTPANTLDLTNGTNAYANTYVGFTVDASNNALGVYNAGTLLTNTSELFVGSQGSGNTMTVADGAVVAAVSSYMSYWAVSSNNSVLVTGTNSLWQNSSVLHVGYSGNGNRLVISNGGTALNFIGSIGTFGSDNIVEVTGAGSLWTNSGDLRLGYEDNANGNQLVVSNGGTVAANRLWVGYWESLSNSLVVTGTNSLLQASNVVVGSAGAGNQLVISDGGTLASAQYGNLGQLFSSSNNVALVTGAGSLWTNALDLFIGGLGSGNRLTVSNAGTVANAAGVVGSSSIGNGNEVVVTGTNSLWTNSADLTIGNFGSSNSLTVSNGGTVANAGGYIGYDSNSAGNSALVTGANSLWTNSGEFTVGLSGTGNTLTLADGGALAASNIIVASAAGSSGTLNLGRFGTNDAAGTILAPTIAFGAGTGAINFNQSDATTITSAISGAGTLNQLGAGTTTLSGANTYSGATIVSGGTLAAGATGALSGNSAVTVDSGGILSLFGTTNEIGSLAGAGVVDNGSAVNAALTAGGDNTSTTFSGNINDGIGGGALSLTKSGAGTLTFAGLGSYSGDTTIGGGELAVSGSISNYALLYVGNEGSGSSLVISNGGTVANAGGYIGFDNTSFNNSVLVTGTDSLWTNSFLFVGYNGSGNSLTIADGGTVAVGIDRYIGFTNTASNNSVLVTGTGSLWSGGDLYFGIFGSGNSLVISDGGTVANARGTIGYATNSSNNSVLVTGTNSLWTNASRLFVGDAGSGNSLVISNGGTVVVNSVSVIGANPISSNNSVLVTGTNSLWTNSGIFVVGGAGSGNRLVISNGGTVANTDGRIGGRGVDNTALVTGAGSLWTNSGTLTIGGSLQSGAASGTLTVASGGTVTAVGGITIAMLAGDTGTLNIGRFGTNDTAGTILAPTIAFGAGTGAINFNQSDAVTITSAISGAGTLNQLGGGTTTLSASNTYTGATTVSAGRLVVDGSIASSAVTVQSGGTLGGSGAVGSTTIESGGTISPGNSPGNLTVEGDLVWNGGGNYNWQVLGTTNTAGFAAGTTWDLLTVTGTLDLTALSAGSKFNINLWSLASTGLDIDGNIADFDPTTGYEWLAVVASNITGFDASSFEVNYAATNGTAGFSNPLDPGYTFGVRQEGGNLYVAYEVVPEPSTYALLAVAAAGCGAHLLRRRKRGKIS